MVAPFYADANQLIVDSSGIGKHGINGDSIFNSNNDCTLYGLSHNSTLDGVLFNGGCVVNVPTITLPITGFAI